MKSPRIVWIPVVFGLLACQTPGEAGDASAGSTSSGADTTGVVTMSTTTQGADTTTGTTDALIPCDPRTDDCVSEGGRCGGAPTAGYYCRPPCSSMASDGDACSDDGLCLPATPGSAELVCVVLTDCDPVTGSGCDLAQGQSCVVLDLEPVRTACEPAGSGGIGQECGPAGGNGCDVGLGCLGTDLADDDPGRCTPWCDPPGDGAAECSVCIPISDTLGTCAECNALDDACPEGAHCQPINETLGGLCIDHGPMGEDEPCVPFDPAMTCADGLLCLELEDDDTYVCVATCDPTAPICDDPLDSCIDVGAVLPGLPTGELGLCLGGVQQYCDPETDPTGCGPGDVCLTIGEGIGVCGAPCDPTQGDAACEGNAACYPEADGTIDLTPFVVGNGACGDGCVDDGDCGGGTCLLVEGLASAGVCGSSCDPAAPNCGAGASCVATTADPMIGACIAGGAACDPADVLSCQGMAEPSCVVLDGGATAVCMIACFDQDPNGCGGSAALCQVRTDEAFHQGVCIGQEPPCDLFLQDCDDGERCVITGGGALGGTASVCDNAGPLGDGDDCSADDSACGVGLQCVADVCVALCDPQADDCVQGSCVDASASVYLPPGSVGFCL